MPGRTWIIAPDAESLRQRWQALIYAPENQKESLFHPHLRKGKLGDKHSKKVVKKSLAGYPARAKTIADERGSITEPTRYGFRFLDRQWIIPDSRLINQPNPELWEMHSTQQVYLTALEAHSPSSGPAVTFTGLIPDLHHYKGSFGGRAFPLWLDAQSRKPNVSENLTRYLSDRFEKVVNADDVLAYIAAVASQPAFTSRFKSDLVKPGLRIPFTSDEALFFEAVKVGHSVIWLQTFGERFANNNQSRPGGPPRLTKDRPQIPSNGAISTSPDEMPDEIEFDQGKRRLIIGSGYVENVTPEIWNYEVSGKNVLRQWFSYRKANRERPIIGERRQPSKLGDIQPDHWLAEYTTELINVLNVIGLLVELEPHQASLLERICSGPTISELELHSAGALAESKHQTSNSKSTPAEQPSLLPQ